MIAGGGFSLLSECVYLHKPALSIPVAGQFEQTLNARYLERLGYGEYAEAPTPEAIGAFLERLPEHEARSPATRRTATTRRSPRCASSSRSWRSSAPGADAPRPAGVAATSPPIRRRIRGAA